MPLLDDIYLNTGSAVVAANLLASTSNLSNPGAFETGIGPAARIYTYDIVPLTLNTAAYAAIQTPAAAAIVLSAGTGVTSATVGGSTVFQADVPRAVTISSGGGDTGITFTVSGFDYYGQAMTQTVTGVSAAAVTTTKAFYQIKSVAHSGTIASTVTVGTADTFGLPYRFIDKTYMLGVNWNNTLAKDAGTLTVADSTTPATAFSGDVRGTYVPASNASNGARRLVITTVIGTAQLGSSATTATVLGITNV